MRLHLPRLHRRDVGESAAQTATMAWYEHPAAVHFETAWARRRFIRIEQMGDAVHFMAPRTRYWPGQHEMDVSATQSVSRSVLPDTVSCGNGYIEVLAFVENGIVVNEVRTHGDRVVAMAGWADQFGASDPS
jgi:hypothetical protein